MWTTGDLLLRKPSAARITLLMVVYCCAWLQLRGGLFDCNNALMHMDCLCSYIGKTMLRRLLLRRDAKLGYLLMLSRRGALSTYMQMPLLAVFWLGHCRSYLCG